MAFDLDRFQNRLAPATIRAPEPLEQVLKTIAKRVRLAHPNIQISLEQFFDYLAQTVSRDDQPVDLSRLFVNDLYLACGCLLRDVAATTTFDEDYIESVRAAVRRVDSRPAVVDDVLQALRIKLLVPDNRKPALALYSGLAPLKSWIRIAAVRAALNYKRDTSREVPADAEFLRLLGDVEPMTTGAGDELTTNLHQAIRDAFTQQPARARAVMRMYYDDNVDLEGIARVYRVHISTVSRWLSSTREAMKDATHAFLRERLGLNAAETDDLLGFAVDLDVTLRELLQTPTGDVA